MPAGNLNIDSNGNKLLEANFEYQSPMPRPEVTYSVNGTEGELRLSQQEHQPHIQFGPSHNTWNLHLAHDIPMQMRVNMGAGRNNLQLGGLDLTRIDVNMGAGLLIADFTGNWKQDVDATFHGGAGNATIRLPKQCRSCRSSKRRTRFGAGRRPHQRRRQLRQQRVRKIAGDLARECRGWSGTDKAGDDFVAYVSLMHAD